MYICSNTDSKYVSLCQNAKHDKYSETLEKSETNIKSQITCNDIINYYDLNPFVTAML